LAGVQTALVFTFDHWESITRLPRGESSGIKQLMASLLSHQLQPQHQATAGHQLWLVSCRTDGQSQALGSALYAQFRNKLLLEGLSVKASQQLLERRLQSIGLGIDFAGVERLNYLTHGNPYWLRKVSDYLMERAQANRMDHLPISFIDKLNLKAPDLAEGGLFDILLTQVKLASSGNEGDVEPTLAILVRAFGTQPWTLNEALTHLPNPLAKGGHKGIGATILNRCLWIGLITPVDPDEVILANATPFTTRGRYQFDGRLLVEALTRMTQHQTYHDPHQEKLELLKQVLPMSVSSGELDPLKTQELLSLSRLMNDDTLVPFLTETLIEATQHEKPVVRASALNNLAFIDADASLALCLKALSDKDPLVREYALRNLQQLSLANLDPMSAKALYEQLFSLVDDTDDTIRTYAYGLLAQVDRLGLLESSVIPALAKGLSDATVSVRQVVMEALTHQPNKYTDAVTPYLMQGLTDPDTTVRIWAYKGVNLHHLENAIGLLSNALVTDPSDSVRVYAAEALSGMDSPEALTILTQALGNHALDEKVKVTIVRAMAKVPGWLTESTLGQVLKQPGPQPATLLWVTIQSLGRIGVTKPTAQLLQQQTHAQDSVVRFAAEKALERVQARLEQFRLYEQHWGDSDGQKAEELLGTNDAFVALGKGTNTNPYAELNDLTGADIDDAHLFAAVADDAY
jgi:HEAT repeat protein